MREIKRSAIIMGFTVYRNFQELSSSGKFSHAFHCVVSYPRNVINKPFRKP